MDKTFDCPYRQEQRGIDFLVCTKQMVKGREYKTTDACMSIICGFQYYCRTKGAWLNTKDAVNCKFAPRGIG